MLQIITRKSQSTAGKKLKACLSFEPLASQADLKEFV